MQETFFFPLEYLDQKNSENLESAIKSFRTEDIKLTIYIYIYLGYWIGKNGIVPGRISHYLLEITRSSLDTVNVYHTFFIRQPPLVCADTSENNLALYFLIMDASWISKIAFEYNPKCRRDLGRARNRWTLWSRKGQRSMISMISQCHNTSNNYTHMSYRRISNQWLQISLPYTK